MMSPRIGVCALGLLVFTGCEVVQEGEQGNFFFRYDTEGVFPFGTDVAVDSRVDIGVFYDEETTDAVPVATAVIDGTDFVLSQTGNPLTVSALQAGEADLTVTDDDGLEDTVNIEAREVDTVELRIPNPFNLTGGEGVFLEQGRAHVPYDLKAGESMLVGYGFPGFTATPAEAATLTDGLAEQDLYFQHVTFHSAGAVTLGHALADDLAVTVVPATDVATLEWKNFGGTEGVEVGTELLLFLEAKTTGGAFVLGTDGAASVSTADEAVCTVAHSDLWGDGIYELSALTAGSCEVTASLNGLTANFDTTVSE